ncbi:MAG: DUF11 domain-containing protein [Chitinophagaceae bacterium]|nr:DUF11 domain-containing protein [Chitinophagaceae bacterium]
MGSININSKGQIALGYNLSSPTKYASIFFTGRNIGDAPNTMSVQEVSARNGTAYGTFGNRWGDYNDMATDIQNDSLFWMTAMYGNAASQWATRITQFKIGDCDVLSSSFNLTQGPPAVPEGQNVTYTNTVNNTGCVAMTNFLLTDTLPTNVTFVSATNGGTYNAGNRVVSWPVNIAAGLTQTYQFTVNINAGSYFPPATLLNETVAAAGIPAGWAATSATGPNNWVSSTASSHSAPNSLFAVDNATAITDFRVATTAPLALGAPTGKLTFWHNYNTESGWDGGVAEISTNGGTTWTDLGAYMTVNGYNNSVGGTNPIAGRPAFSGNSGGWIQTTVNLLSFSGQSALFRFRMTSDDNTASVGWYVDDIAVSRQAQVNIRTSLFNSSGVRVQFKDTITIILPPVVGCTAPSVTSQPANTTVCPAANASFTIAAAGDPTLTYQWQESTNGGGTWNNVTNGGIYSGATTVTLNLTGVTAGMNNYQYRCVVTNTCPPAATSNAAVLTVTAPPTISAHPANTSACATSTAVFNVTAAGTGLTYQWQISTAGAGGPFSNIPVGAPYAGINTATLTINPTVVGMDGYAYRCVVTNSCAASLNSNPAVLTIVAGSVGGTINPANTTLTCATNTGTLTLSGHTGSVLRWESATALAGPYTPIANTTTTLTYNNVTVTTYYRAVVQAAGCTAANSSVATLTVTGALPLTIVADPGTTLCQGDPTRLTVMEGSLATGAPTTTFTNNNQFGMVIFNFRNNNPFPVTITGIESIASTNGASTASLYYKTTPIAGAPGAISVANGWNLSASAPYTAVANTTTNVPQVFLTGLNTLTIPAGATWALGVESKTAANVGNLRYSTIAAGSYTISDGGCDIITGTGVGYAGDIAPATLLNTPADLSEG